MSINVRSSSVNIYNVFYTNNIHVYCQVESSKQNFNNASEASVVPQSPTSDEEYLSDYIQHHRVPLPHLGVEDCALQQNPDEEFQSLETNGHVDGTEEGDESWQNNWMFRKREQTDNDLTSSVSNSSIGMLVPSPTEEVKALIGDRTADEVSDLSEAGTDGESELSDAEEDGDEEVQTNHVDIPHVIVESKTLIGGKNEVESFHQTLLLPAVSLIPTTVTCNNVDVVPIETVVEAEKKIAEDNADVQNSLQTLDDIVSKAEATLVDSISEKYAPIIVDVVHKSNEAEIVHAESSAEVSTPVPAPRYVQYSVIQMCLVK